MSRGFVTSCRRMLTSEHDRCARSTSFRPDPNHFPIKDLMSPWHTARHENGGSARYHFGNRLFSVEGNFFACVVKPARREGDLAIQSD